MTVANLYDWEIVRIHELSGYLNLKYGERRNDLETLEELRKEAIARLSDLGFEAQVDIAPCFAGKPPAVTIVRRIKPKGFDHEEKSWEVNKAKKDGTTIHGLDRKDG